MPRVAGAKKRESKAKQKKDASSHSNNDSDQNSEKINTKAGANQNNQGHQTSLCEEDEYLLKRHAEQKQIQIYLQLADEEDTELIRNVPATFYDVTRDAILNYQQELQGDQFNQSQSQSQKPILPEIQPSDVLQNPKVEGKQNEGGGDIEDQLKYESTRKVFDLRARLFDMIVFLKKQGYYLENTFISYYSQVFSAFVNCNLDPVSKSIWLTEQDFEIINGNLSLRLKFQKGLCKQYTEEEDEQEQSASEVASESSNDVVNNDDEIDEHNKAGATLGKRRGADRHVSGNPNNVQAQATSGATAGQPKTKERTVGYVIEKVAQWRRLYNGYYDQNFNHHRMSLERAADKVGVSKKSLDDYLAQLRAGRQFGYDFNANKDKKVGDLRRFVKEKLDQGASAADE